MIICGNHQHYQTPLVKPKWSEKLWCCFCGAENGFRLESSDSEELVNRREIYQLVIDTRSHNGYGNIAENYSIESLRDKMKSQING